MSSFYRRTILIKSWRVFTGDPEQDALINAMYALEDREGERRGWDQPPAVMLMYLADVFTQTFRVGPVPNLHWRRGAVNPADDLLRVASEVGMPTELPAPTRYADTADGIAAVMFMSEMWGAAPDAMTGEQVARHHAGERIIHTLPASGRIELRGAVAVDVNGTGCTILRVRGREEAEPPTIVRPETMLASAGDGPGRVQRALFALTAAARQGRWP